MEHGSAHQFLVLILHQNLATKAQLHHGGMRTPTTSNKDTHAEQFLGLGPRHDVCEHLAVVHLAHSTIWTKKARVHESRWLHAMMHVRLYGLPANSAPKVWRWARHSAYKGVRKKLFQSAAAAMKVDWIMAVCMHCVYRHAVACMNSCT